MSQTTVQTSLFGPITIERRSRKENKALRHKKAKDAFARANQLWAEAYRAFILEYAESHEEFSAEETREAFNTESPLRTTAEQASGIIFIRLVREGKLRKVDFKVSEKYGNNLRTYSRVAK